MKKLLLVLGILMISCTNVFAAKIPTDVVNYINSRVSGVDFRFDGVIIFPDNTIYLPLYPSLFSDITEVNVKESFPVNTNIEDKPDIVIFNNDFVLMKVLTDGQGRKTVRHLQNPPLQVRTGLLPQDMLVPSGLILPENIKGVIGNLKIDTKSEDVIKLTTKESFEEFLDDSNKIRKQEVLPMLKNKTIFVTTNYSKNIQVLDSGESSPKYALAQKSIPIDVKAVKNGKFLLVTSYERPFIDVISVADSRFIKQINLPAYPEQILLDEENDKAYITSPVSSTIFVVDLNTMSLIQKIRINGYCEKLLLTEDKIFYVDKLKSDIWAIETKNDYTLVNIGNFPNVSALAFYKDTLFVTSRTKSRVAVIDYNTKGLISEFTTANKPIAMQIYGNYLYILGAQNNYLQMLEVDSGKLVNTINLDTEGFSTGLKMLPFTQYAIVIDVKTNKFSIVDLKLGKLLKTYSLNVPIKDVIITDRVELFK